MNQEKIDRIAKKLRKKIEAAGRLEEIKKSNKNTWEDYLEEIFNECLIPVNERGYCENRVVEELKLQIISEKIKEELEAVNLLKKIVSGNYYNWKKYLDPLLVKYGFVDESCRIKSGEIVLKKLRKMLEKQEKDKEKNKEAEKTVRTQPEVRQKNSIFTEKQWENIVKGAEKVGRQAEIEEKIINGEIPANKAKEYGFKPISLGRPK